MGKELLENDLLLITSNGKWKNLTTPGYSWYENDSATYKSMYGALYNWHTINTGKLCPVGWHVPTNDEWTILRNYLGGENIAGGKMKEPGTTFGASQTMVLQTDQDFQPFQEACVTAIGCLATLEN